MNVFGLLYLLLTQYVCGNAILQLFKTELKPVYRFCFSMMLGVPLFSFAPCILQLMNVPITMMSVLLTTAVFTAACSFVLFATKSSFRKIPFGRTELYEWPFILVIAALAVVSIWRCFYYPPYARDILSGAELLAEYTVREKTMINSVYSVDLHTTNNYLKSPYITGLQIVYKLLVVPFGQLWLSVLFVPFTVFIYGLLKERVHALLAGFLSLLFLVIPDLYAYTYLILYDYSNMVFFFCGVYFLIRHMQTGRINDLAFASLLMGIATYIRNETLVLAVMLIPMLIIAGMKRKLPFTRIAKHTGLFLLSSVAFYFICIHVFIRAFVPVHFDVKDSINSNLSDIQPFFQRLLDMAGVLIFSQQGINVYGYFIFLFCALLLSDLLWKRKFSNEATAALYSVAVVYIGLALIGYLIPLADLQNTSKRGLFKALPLMLFYMANSATVQALSARIIRWERKPEQTAQPKVAVGDNQM